MTLLGAGTATAAAASTPLTILSGAGYIGWWDAQDASTFTDDGGGVISQWRDKGSGTDHLNAATTARPTLTGTGATSAVTFDGTSDAMSTTTDGISIGTTDKMAVWFVGQRLTGIAGSARVMGYIAAGQSDDYNNAESATLFWEVSAGNLGAYRQGGKASQTVSADTTVRLLSLWDGSNNDMFLNNTGATPVASTGNFGTTGTFTVGAGVALPPSNFGKIIAKEIVMCAGLTITSGMRSSMETYFTGRW